MSAIPGWAVRGARVVCVRNFSPSFRKEEVPTKGTVYTIRDSEPDGLRLKEITNGVFHYYGVGMAECVFHYRNFRPVIAPKTEAQDLARFRKYLHQNTPELVE